jgi:hypothetical protein
MGGLRCGCQWHARWEARVNHDRLLAYLSEKGSGTWPELKEAWEWIAESTDDPGGRAWIAARDLASLGHIEITWGDDGGWCAAPVVVTMIPRSGGRALVTGARTRFLYSKGDGEESGSGRLTEAAEHLDLWVDECEADNGPLTLFVACKSDMDARRLAEELGVAYTYEVAEQLAALLPPLASYARLWPEGELPRGLDAEWFDPDSLSWESTEAVSEYGLYRCRTYQGHVSALKAVSGWRRVNRELGVFEVLRWEEKPVLAYDEQGFQLSLPAQTPLPALHARSATLCSGRLPRFSYQEGGRLTYDNIPDDIASSIAAALSQAPQEAA